MSANSRVASDAFTGNWREGRWESPVAACGDSQCNNNWGNDCSTRTFSIVAFICCCCQGNTSISEAADNFCDPIRRKARNLALFGGRESPIWVSSLWTGALNGWMMLNVSIYASIIIAAHTIPLAGYLTHYIFKYLCLCVKCHKLLGQSFGCYFRP